MHRSNGVDRDRALAWCCVLVAHLLAGWWLIRPHADPAGVETDGLDIVWIEPALPPATKPPRAADPPRPASSAMTIVRGETRRRDVVQPAATPTSGPDASSSLSAVFLEQGRAWAKEQHPPDGFARNPLTHRTRPRAEERPDSFVMQDAITPASIVAGIGTLLGGPDYTTDPCPRIRDNITDLATGGPGELLDEELRRDRRLCR